MSRASSIVEINGNRYDAATGKMIGTVKQHALSFRTSAGEVLDGFSRQPTTRLKKDKIAARQRIKYTAQNVHTSTQRSKTLMRSAVSKPTVAAQTHRAHQATHQPAAVTPHVAAQPSRRAHFIAKHKAVKKFGQGHTPQTAPLPKVVSGEILRNKNKRSHASNHTVAMPSMVASASHGHIEELLDQALISASAHKHSQKKNTSRSRLSGKLNRLPRWLSFSVLAVTLALVAGYVAWQRVPNVAIRVASARASVNATVPSYVPHGFNFMAPISYSSGLVTLKYQSGTDSGLAYEIAQRKTAMDSSALAHEVLSGHPKVQTSQVKGTTVYIYGDSNHATWVNNGILYTLHDKANLSSDQILKIVGSL